MQSLVHTLQKRVYTQKIQHWTVSKLLMKCWGKAGWSCLDTRSHSRLVNTRLCYHRFKLIATDIDQQCLFLHLFLMLTSLTFCILLSPWLCTWRGLQVYPQASSPFRAPRHWHLAHSELCFQGFCSDLWK